MKVSQPLLIDSNERGPLHDAVVRAAEREGFPVKKEHLQGMGDYKAGNANIECKSISDLIQSTFKGHLQRQIENLDANCERVVLVVHGDIAKYVAMCRNQGRPTSYAKTLDLMLGIFARLTADFDCHIYRAKDPQVSSSFATISGPIPGVIKGSTGHGSKVAPATTGCFDIRRARHSQKDIQERRETWNTRRASMNA